MVAETTSAIATWQDGQERDIYQDFVSITRSIIARTMLGDDLEADAGHKVTAALDATIAHFEANLKTLLLVPDWFPTPDNLRFWRAVGQLEQVVYDLIARSSEQEKEQGNFAHLGK